MYCFGPKHKFERNGPKIYFCGSNWIRKFLHGLHFANSKVFRIQAFLHDAAGSVKSTTYKGPGYCYVLPRFPSFCFDGHVTEMFFCLYVKFFGSSVYSHFNQKIRKQRKQLTS